MSGVTKMRLHKPRPDFSRLLTHESPWAAGYRLGLSEEKVKDLMDKGILVYAYSPKQKKKILVGDGYRERKDGERSFTGVGDVFKGVFRFFISGPKSPVEIVLWMLMLPITLPILLICQLAMAWMAAIVTLCKDCATLRGGHSDYGGGGLFDEVSTARREDIQFLLGTGPYAKEKW